MKFLVLGLPRSGTAWCANWLTTDQMFCFHDPLQTISPRQLVDLELPFAWGAACTGLWMFKEVREVDCPTIVLERPVSEVNVSLKAMGLPVMSKEMVEVFKAAPGERVPWTDLFDPQKAARIWGMLTDKPFNILRHGLLKNLQVELTHQKVEEIRRFACSGRS